MGSPNRIIHCFWGQLILLPARLPIHVLSFSFLSILLNSTNNEHEDMYTKKERGKGEKEREHVAMAARFDAYKGIGFKSAELAV